MKFIFFAVLLYIMILTSPSVNAVYWVAGYVEDALDGTSPNGRTVSLLHTGTLDEEFDTIGPAGNSATSNFFMIDCEGPAFRPRCKTGDILNATVVGDGSGYVSKNIIQITITGSGSDNATENLTINSPPSFTNLTVEDALTSPADEIDLTPATTTPVSCSSILEDYEGSGSIQSITSELYSSTSFFGDTDDKNYHYTNNSCLFNQSYGTTAQGELTCTFDVEYYAEPTSWDCQINATDNYSVSTLDTDATAINSLLSLGVNDSLGFGTVGGGNISSELTAEIVNYGNIKINLSLSGYGTTPGDGNSMSCAGSNISIDYTKYNLTGPNTDPADLSEFETKYTNLTSSPTTEVYNLDYRTNDATNDAKNNTYWRVYVPATTTGQCNGSIIFGATQS